MTKTLIASLAAEVRRLGVRSPEAVAPMAVLRDAREEASGLTFDAAFASFVAKLTIILNQGDRVSNTPLRPREIFFNMRGTRYVRVWVFYTGETQRQCYCYVDRLTGDVYKPDSRRAPSIKHARGNIFDADPVRGCGKWGVNRVMKRASSRLRVTDA